jgi:hypothetical protein
MKTDKSQAETSKALYTELIETLKARFVQHRHRHPDIDWATVLKRLTENPSKLQVLAAMEQTGGEPDVVGYEPTSGTLLFMDCSKETPQGRRSLCYDLAAQTSRKEHSPSNNALSMAAEIGANLLDETQYRDLQRVEPFDTKTSSWLLTPEAIRSRGGALFGDRRYDHVFIYHNGADSYYAVRGFRTWLRV